MAPQIQQSTSATLQCGIYTLKATGVHVLFDGFTIMQPSKKKDSEESDFLPPLKKGDIVKNTKVNGEQHFTAPPPRYTEASLIKTLEEKRHRSSVHLCADPGYHPEETLCDEGK